MADDTKSLEERVRDLEVQALRGRWVAAYEKDLRASALKYARLMVHGFAIDSDGTRVMLNPTDAKDMAEYEVTAMKRAAIGLLRELGIEEA